MIWNSMVPIWCHCNDISSGMHHKCTNDCKGKPHSLFIPRFIAKQGFYLSLHHKPHRIHSCPYAKHDFLLPLHTCIYRHHNGLWSNLLPTHLVVMASAKAVFAVNERYMWTIASSAIAKATQPESTAISQLPWEQRHTDWCLLDMDSTKKCWIDV